MSTPGQMNNSNDHAEKQFFKCTYPGVGGGPCCHVGTVGEYTEHFAVHTNLYRIKCGSCGARFVEEAMFFDHIDRREKSRTSEKCVVEDRYNINNDRDAVIRAYRNRNVHLQLVTREDFEEFQAKKMNSSASKTPQTNETESVRSRSKSAANRRKSNGSTSSPESAADLRLGDARRTPGGFVSTETRPPSTEEDNRAAIGEEPARLAQESVPPLRHDHEPLRHFHNSYEAPIGNGVPSDSWRPPPVPVEFDPTRPPPPFGVQVPIQTADSRQPLLGRHRVEQETAPQHQSDSTAQQQSPGRPDSVPLTSAFSALELGHQDVQRTGDFPIDSSDHLLRGPEDLKEEPAQEDQDTQPAQRASSPQPVPPPNPGQYSLNDLSVPWSTDSPRLSYHIKEESTEQSVSIGYSTRTSLTVDHRVPAQPQNSSCRQDLHNQNAPEKSLTTIQPPVEPQVVRQVAEPPAATRTGPVENQKSSQQQTERRSLEQERNPNLDPLRHFRGLCSIGRSAQVTTAVRTGQPETSLFQFPAIAAQQPRTAPDLPRSEPIAVRTDSQNELDENEIVHDDSCHDFQHDLGRNEPMDIDFEAEDQEPAATTPQDAQTPPGSPEARDSEPEQTRRCGRPPFSTGSNARRVRRDSDESYRPDSPVRRSRSAAKKKRRGPSKPRKGAKGRKPSNRRRSKKISESSEDSNMDDDEDAALASARIRGAPSAPIQQNPVVLPSSDLPNYESSSPEDEPAPAPAPPRRGRPPVRTSVAKPVAKRTRPSTDSEDSAESYHPPQKTTRGRNTRRRSSGARDYDYDPPYRPQVARGSARPTERRTRSQGAADETLELPRTTRARKSTSTVRKNTALSKIRDQLLRQRTPEQVPRQRTPELEISDHEVQERAPRDPSVEGEDEYEEVEPVQEVPKNDGPSTREVKEEPREQPVQRRSRPEFRRPVGAARGSPDIEVISHVRNGRVLSLFSNPSTRESSLARPGSEQRDQQPRPSASPAYPVDREFYNRTRMESRGPVFGQNQPRNPPRPPQEVRVPPRQPQSAFSQGPGQSRLPLLGTRPHQPRNPVPVANTSSRGPPANTSGWVSSRIMRPNEFHRGATHTSYHPSNVRRTLSRGSSGDRSASGGRASSGERDEERRGEPRARAPSGGRAPYRPPSRGDDEYVEAPRPNAPRASAPSGGRAPYRPPSRGGEENREDTVAPRSFAPAGRAHVPPAQPPRPPPSRGQAVGRQERNRLDILRAEQIALQQVGQFARNYDQSAANADALVESIKEEAAKKRTRMERPKQ